MTRSSHGDKQQIKKLFEAIKAGELDANQGFQLFKQSLNGPATGGGIPSPNTKFDESQLLVFLASEWVETTPPKRDQAPVTCPVLLFCDHDLLALAFRDSLSGPCVQVKHGPGFDTLDDHTFSMNPAHMADVQALTLALDQMELWPKTIVFLRGLGEATGEKNLADDPVEASVLSLFHLYRAFKDFRPGASHDLVFAFAGTASHPPQHLALASLFKTLYLEDPRWRCKSLQIDLPEGDPLPADFGQHLSRQIAHLLGEGSAESRWAQNRLFAKRTHLCQLPDSSPIELRQEGTYVITGGLGGLGTIIARHFAAKCQGTLVLVGRSPLDAAKRAVLAEFQQLGPKVIYRSADVADREAANQLIRGIQNDFGPIHGLVHAAGIARDGLWIKTAEADLRAVLSPKIQGSINLDEALAEAPLDFMVFFSSMVSHLGNTGQAGYVYANAFMDHFARQREEKRRQGLRSGHTFSFGWSLWQDGSFKVSSADEARAWQELGLKPLTTAQGLRAFELGLAMETPHALVLAGDREKIQAAFQARSLFPMTASRQHAATPPPQPATSMLKRKTEAYLKRFLAKETKLAISQIHADKDLDAYNIDSMMIVNITRDLEDQFGPLPKTLFFEFQNLADLANYFIENHSPQLLELVGPIASGKQPSARPAQPPAKKPVAIDVTHPMPEQTPARDEPIAIVGLAGRYPMAGDLDVFWENLKAGKDCITEIPADRWDYRPHFHPDKHRQDKSYSKWGGFIDGHDELDALFFNISPKEAELIDPQERLFLETVWRAMEDAGFTKDRLSGQKAGVYVGVMYSDYQLFGVEETLKGHSISTHSFFSSIANRISYFFNLSGPSLALDTLCSSSLTAIHLACESIHRGEVGLAIAGGVNLTLHPSKYMTLSRGKFAASDGRCRSFGEGGDGYVPSEGVGCVFLKPLRQAVADGDRIHALIRGTAINHGGKTNGLSVPNPIAQGECIAQALRKAGVSPQEISYLEAHGTGTSLGDPIEISGLTKAFRSVGGPDALEPGSCAIGSVKSNIGHAESAAGIAGLTKIVLQMKHRQLVPSLHSQALNPNIDFSKTPFVVQRSLSDWGQRTDPDSLADPLIAGLSSFGAGGANAHLVLESYADQPESFASVDPPYLMVLSAQNEERLRDSAKQLANDLGRRSLRETPRLLEQVAFTLQAGRTAMDARLAILTDDLGDFSEKLRQVAQGEPQPQGVLLGAAEAGRLTAMLLEGEAGAAFFEVVMRDQDLAKLAQLWVSGINVDWRLLYGATPPRMISLPGYPFAKERFWVPTSGDLLAPARTSQIHPLLGANTSTLKEQKFSTTFDGREFFMEDHRVGSLRILPAAAILEMARAAGALANEQPVWRIENMTWARPVTLPGDAQSVSAHLSLFPEQTDVSFELWTQTREAERLTHARGSLIFGHPTPPEPSSIDELRRRCPHQLSGANCYDYFQAHGVHYGPSFRVIQNLWVGETEALSRLESQNHVGADEFLLHPSLLDGALQSVLGLLGQAEGTRDTLYLPYSLNALILRQPPGQTCYVHVRAHGPATDDGRTRTFDLTLLDESGRPCVELEGLVLRAATAGSQPTTARQDWFFYQPAWENQPLNGSGDRENGVMWAMVPNAEIVSQLRQTTAATPANNRIIGITPGTQYRQHSDDHFSIRMDSKEDYLRLVETLAKRDLLPLTLLHLWAFGSYEDTSKKKIQHALDAGFHSLFHLSQTLIREKPKSDIQLLFAFPEKEPILANLHAAVAGFMRTLRLEYPRISGKTLGLPAGPNGAAVLTPTRLQLLLGEFRASTDQIQEVRYRQNQRQVLSLQPYSIDAAEKASRRESLRQGQTILITGGMGQLGWLFAKYLATEYQARLVLTGRSPLDSEKQEKLAFLKSCGADAIYLQADVSRAASLKEMMAEIKAQFGDLHGVIHAAGVIRDAFLIQKTRRQTAEVLAPKVWGTLFLDRVTKDERLAFFINFSTLAASFGNYGQSDYAFANHFLDRFAETRTRLQAGGRRHGKTLTLAWPFWRDGGMALAESARKWMEEKLGWAPLETAQGFAAFEAALHGPAHHLLVLCGDRQKIARLGSEGPQAGRSARLEDQPASAAREIGEPALQPQLDAYLKELVSVELKLAVERISAKTELEQYGLESVMVMNLTRELETHFGELSKTLFFEYHTIAELRDYLLAHHGPAVLKKFAAQPAPILKEDPSPLPSPTPLRGPVASKPPQSSPNHRFQIEVSPVLGKPKDLQADPIAIIGMSGRYPMAPNLDAFWENLQAGKDCITEIPPERWDHQPYYQADGARQGKCNSKWGGFLEGVDQFDSLFFNISPREAKMMDPQERIFLETAWHTLEDAGYTRESLTGNQVGVYVGVMYAHYQLFSVEEEFRDTGYIPSSLHASIANRVSYVLDLRGPSMAVDTMCSSSLSAFHLAVQAIQRGECDLALAGGVNLSLHPNKYLALGVGTFTSSDGRCRSFGEGGDGYVPGEGAGAVLLKPLSKAKADGDHIYAVVAGSAINHGGKAQGFSVPNPAAQAKVIERAFANANLDTSQLGYLETHGTGTPLGDPIEIEGLAKAFERLGTEPSGEGRKLPIGSVKSNIGHLEAAAGIAAIHKVLLQLKHSTLVPSLHAKKPNPFIQFEKTPFFVQQDLGPWPQLSKREGNGSRPLSRQAGISSFGAGGANAHVILEEVVAAAVPFASGAKQDSQKHLILLSAKDKARLQVYADDLARYLDREQRVEKPISAGSDTPAGPEPLLTAKVARLLHLDPGELDPEESWTMLGLEPVTFARLAEWLAKTFGTKVEMGAMVKHPNLRALARFIELNNAPEGEVPANSKPSDTTWLRNAAFTLQVGRKAMEARLALVVDSISELKTELLRFAEKGEHRSFKLVPSAADPDSTPEIEEARLAYFARGDWDAIARQWLAGADINWLGLYQKQMSTNDKPNRIPLPTYPFARKKHWLPRAASAGSKLQAISGNPLIDGLDPSASHQFDQGMVFRKTFHPTDSLLQDHRLDGVPILAGVCYLEMALAAALELEPHGDFQLENVVLPIPLPVSQSQTAHLRLTTQAEPWRFEIRTGSGGNGEHQLHAQGLVRKNPGGPIPPQLDLEAFQKAATQKAKGSDVYATLERFRIHYGNAFRVLAQVWLLENQLLARLTVPEDTLSGTTSRLAHPGLLDGALQSIAAFAMFGKAVLEPKMPFSFQRVAIKPCPSKNAYAHILPAGNGRHHIRLLDENGSAFAVMEDVMLRGMTPKPMVEKSAIIAEIKRDVRPLPLDIELMARAHRALQQITELSRHYMLDVFRRMGAFKTAGETTTKDSMMAALGIVPEYIPLFLALLDILEEGGFIRQDGPSLVTRSVSASERLADELARLPQRTDRFIQTYPDFATYMDLLKSCTRHYPAILRGERHAMDVGNPQDIGLVEAYADFFSDNALVHRTNEMVSRCVASYLRTRLPDLAPGETLRIIEIGGGTGELAKTLLDQLDSLAGPVEYLFTDVGPSLLERAKRKFSDGRPHVSFEVLDIEQDPQAQGIAAENYHLVLADNVVHATNNVRGTLGHLKSLLARDGVLILSETTRIQDFNTICMGILDGWWRFDDSDIRLKHSTLLGPAMWEKLLEEQGFQAINSIKTTHDDQGLDPGHCIFLAEAGTEKTQPEATPPAIVNESEPTESRTREIPASVRDFSTPAPPAPAPQPLHAGNTEARVRQCVAEALNLEPDEIDRDKAFSEYGVDSIIGVELINTINDRLGIDIRVTALFDYGNLREMAQFIAREYAPAALGQESGSAQIEAEIPPAAAPESTSHLQLLTQLAEGGIGLEEVLAQLAPEPQDRAIHPFIDRWERRDDGRFVFTKTLALQDRVFAEHKVLGRAILPGVGYLEMAHAAGAKALGETRVALADVTLIRPIEVLHNTKNTQVVLEENARGLTFEILCFDEATKQDIVCAQGQILHPAKAMHRAPSLASLREGFSDAREPAVLYQLLQTLGIEYGPSYQCLTGFWLGNGEALAQLSLPGQYQHELPAYTLHPMLMDSAMQAIAGVFMDHRPIPALMLPFSFEKVSIERPLEPDLYVHAKRSPSGNVDVLVYTQRGELCLCFANITLREVPKPAPEVDFLIQPSWRITERPRATAPSAATGTILLFEAPPHSSLIPSLQASMPAANIQRVQFGSHTRALEADAWSLDSRNPEALGQLLGDLPKLDAIYFFAGFRAPASMEDPEPSPDDQLEVTILGLFRIVKSLLRLGFGERTLALKVITSHALAIRPGEINRPKAAVLHGFVRSLAKEQPQWDLSVIDLDDGSAKPIDSLARTIVVEPAQADGAGVAYREGLRYVRSFARLELPPAESLPFKKRGGYVMLGGAGAIGVTVSQFLAKTACARLVWIGRSDLGKAQLRAIEEIRAFGGEVHYVQADAANPAQMARAIVKAKAALGTIDGAIQAAMVHRDKAIADMDEATLQAVMAPKVAGGWHFYRTLQNEQLDFFVFFSSGQTFWGNAYQSHYAAACAYEEALAHHMALHSQFPVKIIHWGYWGDVGKGATEAYRRLLASQGVHGISAREGIEAFKRIVAHPVNQVMPMKVEDRLLQGMGVDLSRRIRLHASTRPSAFRATVEHVSKTSWDAEGIAHCWQAINEIEHFGRLSVLAAFQKMGVFQTPGERHPKQTLPHTLRVIPEHHALLDSLWDILRKPGFIRMDGHDLVTTEVLGQDTLIGDLQHLAARKEALAAKYPAHQTHLTLLSRALELYPKLLRGEVKSDAIYETEWDMVDTYEPLFKGNALIDRFNDISAQCMVGYIRARLPFLGDGERIQILEVGGGTGGSTEAIVTALAPYAEKVRYVFTDISGYFVSRARAKYGKNRPYTQFKVLNIENDLLKQGFKSNTYDFVMANNVVHATTDIRKTLDNLKPLLKKRGNLVLNELTTVMEFNTLTMGVLPGWWHFVDGELRLPQSPLLDVKNWTHVLQERGFPEVSAFTAIENDGHEYGQHIILAESDGQVLVSGPIPSAKPKPAKPPAKTPPNSSPIEPNQSRGDGQRLALSLPEFEKKILHCFSEALGLDADEVNRERSFADYGMDSIIGVEFINTLNDAFGITVRTTALFDYGNVKALAEYFHREYGHQAGPTSNAEIKAQQQPFEISRGNSDFGQTKEF